MARPSKSVAVASGHMTEEERLEREAVERSLRGAAAGKLRPPSWLTTPQKKVFRTVVRELEASGILGALDVYVLANFAVAVDRLEEIEGKINEMGVERISSVLISAKDKYTKDFFRGCSELCLSPQARAKIGSLSRAAKKEDPLAEALREDAEG